jgi:phage repressor protein C with HTH and peptisase S24 domain
MDAIMGTPVFGVNRFSGFLPSDNIGMSIGTRVKQARKAARMTQIELATRSGLKQSSISDLEVGKSQGTTYLASLASALGVNPLWLETGRGTMHGASSESGDQDDSSPFIEEVSPAIGMRVRGGGTQETVPIRAVKLHLQAGVSGFVAEPDMDIDHGIFEVPKEVIDTMQLNPADLIIMSVKGQSMQPMMFEDDKVLVDTSKRTPIANECFAVNWNGEPIVKCLIKKAEGWALYSMNPKFKTIDVRSGQCSIIGMVVWQPARFLTGRI